jgi:hypothetical protein
LISHPVFVLLKRQNVNTYRFIYKSNKYDMINNDILSLRITKEDKAKLTEMAKEQRLSVSAYVRQKTLAPKPTAYVLKND